MFSITYLVRVSLSILCIVYKRNTKRIRILIQNIKIKNYKKYIMIQ